MVKFSQLLDLGRQLSLLSIQIRKMCFPVKFGKNR